MTHPIPTAALDDRLGFVGTSGSGKTYAAKGCVEALLELGHRVVIVDPLDVWFGLRLSIDGLRPAFPVAILGGRHADLPLNEHAGAVIGEAVATSPESCIVSLSGLRTSASRERFMLAFLDALYERTDPDARDPYHVVFDEADLWAPQRPMGSQAMLCHLVEEIVRRGRVKGFIPWVITQRPAVINKNVLSQVDGLVAMKLTSSQDREALGAWIEGQADRQQGKDILASLPTLSNGQGIVWLPGRGILTTSTFPENKTFDSSRTPKRGEAKRETALKPLDLPSLKDRLAAVETEAKANDPKALKARIAELERNAKPNADFSPVDPTGIAAAERRGHERGIAEGKRAAVSAFATLAGNLAEAIGRTEAACADARRLLNSFATFAQTQSDAIVVPARQLPAPAIARKPAADPVRATKAPKSANPAGEKLLRALSRYSDRWLTWGEVCIAAGLLHGNGYFYGGRKWLVESGFALETDGAVQIMRAGLDAIGGPFKPLTIAEIVALWAPRLRAPGPAMLAEIDNRAPNPMTVEQLAAATNFKPGNGYWYGGIAAIRDPGLIVQNGGSFALSPFLLAARA